MKLEKKMASLLKKIQEQQETLNAERRTIFQWLVGMRVMCKVNQMQMSFKVGHSQFEDHTCEVMLGHSLMLTLKTDMRLKSQK